MAQVLVINEQLVTWATTDIDHPKREYNLNNYSQTLQHKNNINYPHLSKFKKFRNCFSKLFIEIQF